MNPTKFRNRKKHSTEVEVIGEAEMRVGEIKSRITVYTRGGKLYARTQAEFADKFEPISVR